MKTKNLSMTGGLILLGAGAAYAAFRRRAGRTASTLKSDETREEPRESKEAMVMHTSGGEMPDASSVSTKVSREEIEAAFSKRPESLRESYEDLEDLKHKRPAS